MVSERKGGLQKSYDWRVVCLGHWRLADRREALIMICWGAYLGSLVGPELEKEGRDCCGIEKHKEKT